MQINILFCSIDDATLPILKMVRGWGCRDVIVWMDRQTARQTCAWTILSKKLIDDHIALDHSVVYYEWRSDHPGVEYVNETSVKAAIQRMRSGCPSCFVMIGKSPKSGNRFVGFVDADHRDDLPDEFSRAAWFSNPDDLLVFCEKQGVFKFNIQNACKYQRTQRTEQGAPVYREIDTGNYVYLDRCHLTHYEVFGPTGIHLGEKSLDGELNRAKADAKKHFKP